MFENAFNLQETRKIYDVMPRNFGRHREKYAQ